MCDFRFRYGSLLKAHQNCHALRSDPLSAPPVGRAAPRGPLAGAPGVPPPGVGTPGIPGVPGVGAPGVLGGPPPPPPPPPEGTVSCGPRYVPPWAKAKLGRAKVAASKCLIMGVSSK